MSRIRQVPSAGSVDLEIASDNSFATYELTDSLRTGVRAVCSVSTLIPVGFALQFAKTTIHLGDEAAERDSQVLDRIHASTGSALMRLASDLSTGSFPLSGVQQPDGPSLKAVTRHLRFYSDLRAGRFGGKTIESTAAKYILASSFGVSTVHEFLAAFDGISVAAFKSRLQRARAEGVFLELDAGKTAIQRGPDAG